MNTFPDIGRHPNFNFTDEKSDEAVQVGPAASGYPVLNKLFTFDPRRLTPEYRAVSNTSKLAAVAFYEANKDVPFYWFNKHDGVTYEVCFLSKPGCRLDGRNDLWRIALNLLQTTP